jgi:hypothetical protein
MYPDACMDDFFRPNDPSICSCQPVIALSHPYPTIGCIQTYSWMISTRRLIRELFRFDRTARCNSQFCLEPDPDETVFHLRNFGFTRPLCRRQEISRRSECVQTRHTATDLLGHLEPGTDRIICDSSRELIRLSISAAVD